MTFGQWWETGVDCLIRAGGHYVASGVTDIDTNSREETTYGIHESCFFNVLSGLNGNNVRDHAVVSATANAAGEIVGTFAGTADGAGTFCGLQVEGESFAEECRGLLLLVR